MIRVNAYTTLARWAIHVQLTRSLTYICTKTCITAFGHSLAIS